MFGLPITSCCVSCSCMPGSDGTPHRGGVLLIQWSQWQPGRDCTFRGLIIGTFSFIVLHWVIFFFPIQSHSVGFCCQIQTDNQQTDGRTNRQTDGPAARRTDQRTIRQTNQPTLQLTSRQTDIDDTKSCIHNKNCPNWWIPRTPLKIAEIVTYAP